MGEGLERRGELVAQGAVGAFAGMFALYADAPGTAAAVGAAGALAQAAVLPTIQRWSLMTQRLGERAAGERGPEALEERLRESPAAAALLSDLGYAAARTEYEVKLEAIARALADGLLYEEGTAFDTHALVARMVSRLERPHVAVLSAVVSAPGGVLPEHIWEVMPELKEPLDNLVADLEALGLVAFMEPVRSDLPGSLRRSIRAAGSGRSLDDVLVDEMDRAWKEDSAPAVLVASLLGTRVMRLYVDAAQDVGERAVQIGPPSRALVAETHEYLGPVLPRGEAWSAPASRFRRGQRSTWVLSDGSCEACDERLVQRCSINMMAGGRLHVTTFGDHRCPSGHSEVEEPLLSSSDGHGVDVNE